MAKRLTDTRKWDKRWFRELKPKYKCFWQYICDRCDNAGIWEVDIKTAEHYIKAKLDLDDVKNIFNKHILVLNSERWFVVDFIEFQYNCSIEGLNPNNKAHLSVIRLIEKYNIKGALKGLIEAPLRGPKDKDKDKDKDMDKDKDKDKDITKISQTIKERFEKFWEKYPRKLYKKATMPVFFEKIRTDKDWEQLQIALTNYNNSKDVEDGTIMNAYNWLDVWEDWINYKELKKGTKLL